VNIPAVDEDRGDISSCDSSTESKTVSRHAAGVLDPFTYLERTVAMKAVTWHGKRDVRVDAVPDPKVEEPTDAVIEVTSTNICGSDLHLYEILGAFMNPGDILGHEPMGIVRETGPEITNLAVGDRVVIPFQISYGSCDMCNQQLFTQCETTQVRDQGMGAALFGYSELYGSVPGGQAELLRVPQAQFTHIKVPDGPPDSRFVYLSDVLPTAWQAVAYADIPDGGSVTVLGLGPIGDMAARIAAHLGYQVIAVDRVPERIARAQGRGIHTIDLNQHDDDLGDVIRDMIGDRRCRDGGARFARCQDRPTGHRTSAGRGRQTDDAKGRC
jgi:threonine dehydrogenase-like Zn-dependent dehydrogenase